MVCQQESTAKSQVCKWQVSLKMKSQYLCTHLERYLGGFEELPPRMGNNNRNDLASSICQQEPFIHMTEINMIYNSITPSVS
jgi:hypothetical protein